MFLRQSLIECNLNLLKKKSVLIKNLRFLHEAIRPSKQDPKAICYISSSTNPFFNLALEQYIFEDKQRPENILFLWRNSPCVVIGRNQNVFLEVDVKKANADHIPIIRRKSGGGTVYHDLGNSIFTVMTSKNSFHRDSAAKIICNALNSLDIPSEINKRHDIVVNEKKVSGSAYKLTNEKAYHHGTMLISSNLENLGKYLHSPYFNEIQAKGVASVRSEVTSLIKYSQTIDHDSFCKAVERYYKLSIMHIDITDGKINESGLLDPYFESSDIRSGETLRFIESEIETINIDESFMQDIPEIQKTYEELQTKSWLLEQQPTYLHKINISNENFNFNLSIVTSQGSISEIQGSGLKIQNDVSGFDLEDDILMEINQKVYERLFGSLYDPKLIFEKYAEMRSSSLFGLMDLAHKQIYEEFIVDLMKKVY